MPPAPASPRSQEHKEAPSFREMAMSDEEAASSSSCYQQLDDPPGQLPPPHNSRSSEVDSDDRHPPDVLVRPPEPPSWSFADTGDGRRKLVDDDDDDFPRPPPRLLSRDGSHHVTDEVFNSASHLFAAILSLLGTVLLITQSGGDAWKIVSFGVYGSSLMFLFACSTLHHAISGTEEVEARLRMLDYLAIYPLIAGTFTPLCLVCLRDSVIGWSFLGVAWFLAFAGMTMTATFGVERIPTWLSMTSYVTMGWLGGILATWLAPKVGGMGMGAFVMGGVAYTAGGYVFVTESPNPVPGRFGFHEIWHVTVILGAAFHYAVMYFYVLPWEG